MLIIVGTVDGDPAVVRQLATAAVYLANAHAMAANTFVRVERDVDVTAQDASGTGRCARIHTGPRAGRLGRCPGAHHGEPYAMQCTQATT